MVGSDLRQRLLDECERIEEFALWNATAHFTAAALVRRAHVLLGVVPIVLGGLGSWKGLQLVADDRVATVWSSLAAAAAGVLGSVLAFLNLAETRAKHFKAGTSYKTLENEARRARSVFVDTSLEELRKEVAALAARYDRLGEEAVQSGDLAFWLAGRKVRGGRYQPDKKAVGR